MYHRKTVFIVSAIVTFVLVACGDRLAEQEHLPDAVCVAEYVVVSQLLDTAFAQPVAEFGERINAIDFTGVGIEMGLAEFESALRSLDKCLMNTCGVIDSLTPAMNTQCIKSFLKETADNARLYRGELSITIGLLEQIGGSRYKFIARSDELLRSLDQILQLDCKWRSSVLDSVAIAAGRILDRRAEGV